MRRKRQKITSAKKEVASAPDRKLLVLTILLTLLGIVAIANASAPMAQSRFGNSFYFVRQQGMWAAVGLVLMAIASRINYTYWKKIAPVFFYISIALLVLVLIPGFGTKIYGARRWLDLGVFGFQPSEVVKLSLAAYIAYLSETQKQLTHYLAAIGTVIFLIILQPDMGTMLIVSAIAATQLFVIGINAASAITLGVPAVLAGVLMVFLSDYRRERLMTFLQSGSDPLDSSYHIRQILLALGSGGIYGVGLGQSRQKYLFIPEVATDSVFAVIGEEVGFVGSAFVVLLMTFVIFRMLKIAISAPDDFGKILATGISVWIAVQFFLNIGSMIALVPLTGIPLPFFSYGGTSLSMTLFAIGILLNISKFTSKDPRRK